LTQPPAGPPPTGSQQPEGSQPGYPPPSGPASQPRKRRTGLLVGAVVAAVVLIAGISAAVVLTVQGKTPLSSEEQQVEAALRDFYGTLTDDGFRSATELACKADRDEFDAMSESEKSEAEKLEFGVEVESVDNIVVTGDRAEAEIKGKFSFAVPGGDSDDQVDDSSKENLVKEDGEWRVCSSAGADTA
jgi:hypothetical protein